MFITANVLFLSINVTLKIQKRQESTEICCIFKLSKTEVFHQSLFWCAFLIVAIFAVVSLVLLIAIIILIHYITHAVDCQQIM